MKSRRAPQSTEAKLGRPLLRATVPDELVSPSERATASLPLPLCPHCGTRTLRVFAPSRKSDRAVPAICSRCGGRFAVLVCLEFYSDPGAGAKNS